MSRRYRHVPLSDDRLRHYERMRFHVTKKRFGEYSDVDIDIAAHCQDTRIPFFLIHNPRRYCSIDLDWSTAGFELSLPGYQQVNVWAQTALDASSAPKKQKSAGPIVSPRSLVAHGLELEHAQQLCQHVWEFLLTDTPAIRGDPGGDGVA